MIRDQDRSGYIGASDTKFVMGNWKTKTFKQWWGEKLGLIVNDVHTSRMEAGTMYERRILDHLEIFERDEQIIDGRLRVNLDGYWNGQVVEVKTFNWENGFVLPKEYIQQVQVQMYAKGVEWALLVAYGLTKSDYRAVENGRTLDIDSDRMMFFPIAYSEEFIKEYLPRLKKLEECLEKGEFPYE